MSFICYVYTGDRRMYHRLVFLCWQRLYTWNRAV